MIFQFQLHIIFSFVVCLITGIRVMIESHQLLMVNISACLPLIVITVNVNSLLKLKTARPIREQKIAIICGNEEMLVTPGDMKARSRRAKMRFLLQATWLLKTIHSYLICLRASSITTWITASTTAGVVTSMAPSKAGQGKWQGHRASGHTRLLIARLSGYANIARPDTNTGMLASTLQIHDIPLQKLPFL